MMLLLCAHDAFNTFFFGPPGGEVTLEVDLVSSQVITSRVPRAGGDFQATTRPP